MTILSARKEEVTQEIKDSCDKLMDITAKLERASLGGSRGSSSSDRLTPPPPYTSSNGCRSSTRQDRISVSHTHRDESSRSQKHSLARSSNNTTSRASNEEQPPTNPTLPPQEDRSEPRFYCKSDEPSNTRQLRCPQCYEAIENPYRDLIGCPECLSALHSVCVDSWTDECRDNGEDLHCPSWYVLRENFIVQNDS